jgi:hypothetical protein
MTLAQQTAQSERFRLAQSHVLTRARSVAWHTWYLHGRYLVYDPASVSPSIRTVYILYGTPVHRFCKGLKTPSCEEQDEAHSPLVLTC